MIPFHFLLGALALSIPFIAHAQPMRLGEPWVVAHAYTVALPAFIALVLLLHMLTGPSGARVAAVMPVLAGVVAALASLASGVAPVGVDPAMLPPSALTPLATGLSLGFATASAALLLEWWHKEVRGAPLVLVFIASTMAGLLAHGLLSIALGSSGIPIPGGAWPAIVAVPLVAGAAPALFVAIYAEGLVADLAPIVRRAIHDPDQDKDLEAYRDADERYRSALDEGQSAASAYADLSVENGAGVFLAAADGRIIHANTTLGGIMERDPDDLLGKPAGTLLFGPTRRPSTPRLGMNGSLRGHRAIVQLPGGRERFLSIHLEALPGGGVRGEVSDLTEDVLRREAAEHRRRAMFTLELLTADLPNHLLCPRSSLEALAYEHDLPAEATRLAERAHRSIVRLEERMSRLSVLARAQKEAAQPTELGDVVRSAAQRTARMYPEAPAIHWDLPRQEMHVHANSSLSHAIENVLKNAYEHTPPDAQITLGAHREDGGWMIRIEDDGPGVPHEFKDRIFNGFVHASKAPGKGLGLYLARAVVTELGGRIRVQDRVRGAPDEGACFCIWLPEAEGYEPGTPSAQATTTLHEHGTRGGEDPGTVAA